MTDACEFTNTGHHHQQRPRPVQDVDGDDDDDIMPSNSSTFLSNRHHHHHHHQSLFLFPPNDQQRLPSLSMPSTAASTPVPSRSTSPLPSFYHPSRQSSPCPSDSDSEDRSYSLGRESSGSGSSSRTWRQNTLANRRSWWSVTPRRRRHHGWRITRQFKRLLRRTIFHPICANQPLTIVLILILFSLLAIAITLLIMYILNPDKEPLPWRAYCTAPSLLPPFDRPAPPDTPHVYPNATSGEFLPSFPPPELDQLPPAGVFVGIFSTDNAFERRQFVRTTWASHPRSRDGAGVGDNGIGTSRTLVRFVLGQPRKDWERRVKLEMETYNDIIMLPIPENMNNGKSHTFFSWAAINAFVPPVYNHIGRLPSREFSYSNSTAPPPPLAPHDPLPAWDDALLSAKGGEKAKHWVRPDYVVKVDDDSFLMLAELEARLRWELHQWPQKKVDVEADSDNEEIPEQGQDDLTTTINNKRTTLKTTATSLAKAISTAGATASRWVYDSRNTPFEIPSSRKPQSNDPLIYWGYLVTNRLHMFMAGELYALSWSLVDWASKDPTVKTMKKGAEDKQTAKWMKIHPRADEIRWTSERCWIYDHPRSGTVYSHGYLFPSEATRVRNQIAEDLEKAKVKPATTTSSTSSQEDDSPSHAFPSGVTPSTWAHSSVSTFGVRYAQPLPDLSATHSVEALVEGSPMSLLREGTPMTPEYAWEHREGRRTRYEGKRVGGTIVVHFIKKNMWYLETAMALLHGDEVSESEEYEQERRRVVEQVDVERNNGFVNMRLRERHIKTLVAQLGDKDKASAENSEILEVLRDATQLEP